MTLTLSEEIEKYEELCRKAEAIDAIRAEIEARLNGSNDLLYDRGIVDCLDIIDRHIGKESEE